MRILKYTPEKLYRNNKLVDYLVDNLNNAAESSFDNNGIYVGSAMKSSLLWERKMLTWVCWEAGSPIAWATLTPRREATNIFGISLYVGADYRKRGVGTAIVNKILAFAIPQEISIVAQPWNDAGERFYKKHKIEYTPYWDSSTNKLEQKLKESFAYSKQEKNFI